MSTHKHIDRICCAALLLALVLTALFVNGESFGLQKASTAMAYETALFDTSKVHTINIIMDDWDEFTANCKSEEYYACTVVIDGETFKNVAIRGKGNTSLSQVTNDRYSYKIEFDHYTDALTYHGLDKLCLNNIIQDNTYMKDYLCYQMMQQVGVAAPLCSYAYLTVNGEDWGLYLAVEAVEESFLQRSYGSDYGELYKPDSTEMGGGRGNGQDFTMPDTAENTATNTAENTAADTTAGFPNGQMLDGFSGGAPDMGGGNFAGGSGSADVLLQYIDDDPDSYSNIFDNAKTSCSEADKARLIAALKTLSGEDASSAVDVDMVIRYFVAHNFVLNFDSYTGSMIHNYYLYEKGGQLQMIPWDYNLAFGGFQSSGGATALVNYPIDTPVSGGSIDERPMLAWIFADEEYTALYHQYFAEFIAEYFDSGYFSDMMDSVKAMIAPYVQQDPTKFCTYEEFETGIDTLKAFCLLRAESISAQLSGAIGSTSDTQDEATLIDAGSLQISDMGSMGGGMGKNIGNSIGDDIGDPIGNGTDSDAPQPNNGQDTQTDASDRPSPPDGTPPDFSDDSMGRTPPRLLRWYLRQNAAGLFRRCLRPNAPRSLRRRIRQVCRESGTALLPAAHGRERRRSAGRPRLRPALQAAQIESEMHPRRCGSFPAAGGDACVFRQNDRLFLHFLLQMARNNGKIY